MPAAAAQGKPAIDWASNFGNFPLLPKPAALSCNPRSPNRLLPDKSNGDSAVERPWITSPLFGDTEGLRLVRLSADDKGSSEDAAESCFRFLAFAVLASSSSEALRAAANCCKPPCDNN